MKRSTAFWFLASAGLLGAILIQINDSVSLSLPVTAATLDPGHERSDHAEATDIDIWNENWRNMIVERPLFSVSRRPFSPVVRAEAVAVVPKVEPLPLTLSGTLLAGKSRIALLAHPIHGFLRVRQGQNVDGWKILEVREDEVRLRRDHMVTLLSLRKDAFGSIQQRPRPEKATENLEKATRP